MEMNKVLENRRCTRKFKDKRVSEKDVLSIMDSALKAPCSGGIFSVRLILVDDKEQKNKVAEACLGQDFIARAPYVIVTCSERKQTEKMYGKFSSTYLRQQAGAAMENMFLKAVDLGLSACWVGGLDDKAIKRILEIPEDVDVEAVMPIGYADEKPGERFKPELFMVSRFNSYKKKASVKKKIVS